ncbi:hypothetical protein L208DRAFT_1226231, partial [Tricholoma matsutake]
VQSQGHEMLPNFIGRWFPRKDHMEEQELYTASMLVLLQSWGRLHHLKSNTETFDEAFAQFKSLANLQTLSVIDNIQYYYE